MVLLPKARALSLTGTAASENTNFLPILGGLAVFLLHLQWLELAQVRNNNMLSEFIAYGGLLCIQLLERRCGIANLW